MEQSLCSQEEFQVWEPHCHHYLQPHFCLQNVACKIWRHSSVNLQNLEPVRFILGLSMMASTCHIHRWWLVTIPRAVSLSMWPSIVPNWGCSLTNGLWTLWTQEHCANLLGWGLPSKFIQSMVSANYSRWNLCLHFSSEFRRSLFCSPRAHWTVSHQTLCKSAEIWNGGEDLLGSDCSLFHSHRTLCKSAGV